MKDGNIWETSQKDMIHGGLPFLPKEEEGGEGDLEGVEEQARMEHSLDRCQECHAADLP